ncbi:armadillo-type protein [Xylariales sp. AK1849]|nr:armadillo-type protein [Xylariales sp. AK1849]
MATPFGNTPWSGEGIWGNRKNVIGSAFSQREPSGSRGSEDASPTAPSGSAQLNHQSDPEPWGPRGLWANSQDNSTQGRPTSGSTSPSHTRDNGIVQQSLQDSQYFQTRSVVGQNGSPFPTRTQGRGPLDPSSTALQNRPGLDSPMNGEMESVAQFPSMSSRYSYDNSAPFKRGSQDQTFSGLGQSRGDNALNPRHSDFSSQTNPGSLNDLSTQYSFDHPMTSNPRGSLSRPSVPHHSGSFPTNGPSGRGLPSSHARAEHELSHLLATTLKIDDSLDNDAASLASNGYPNPASQPFQFNPSSQTWNEYGNSGRGLGQVYPQAAETYSDQYFGKRGSVERGSPGSASFHRPSLDSPRFAPTPGSRETPWPSRPISRNQAMNQSFERQQSFSQNPTFYSQQYFGNNYPTQYPTPITYDPYGQSSGFRGQVPVPPYGLSFVPPVSIPHRPSRDDPGKGMRSGLLEEFRASNRSNKRYELKDIYGHIVEFSGDQHGSRFIQEKLQSANSDEKDQVFKEIKLNALQLMKDVFGNYVIQKFFEHGNQVQKKYIAMQMKGKVAELSTQMYACRVVQKALEHVLVEQQEEIVEELKPDIMRIVKDQNGNHVIQKIISMVPRMCIPFMMTTFRGQINNLAAHNYGCRVIQRMLEHGAEAEKRELMEEIHACAPQLITDQYGNYVAQHIVGHGTREDRDRMIRLVIDDLLILSKHKFASNVVEKCIEHGTEDDRVAIRIKLTTPLPDGTSPLQSMIKDQFGNYVIQKLHSRLSDEDKEDFRKEMEPQFASLKKTASGRQITAIDRLIAQSNEAKGSSYSDNTLSTAARPSTPGLQIDVNSTAPTPDLTEHNSPESCSPPSTLSATDETIIEKESGKTDAITSVSGQPRVVEADEAERQ